MSRTNEREVEDMMMYDNPTLLDAWAVNDAAEGREPEYVIHESPDPPKLYVVYYGVERVGQYETREAAQTAVHALKGADKP